jgi:small multidrug resistance family-3 protein
VVATFAEIDGGYLVWLWLRDRRKNPVLGVVGGLTLLLYGIIPTF